MGAYVSPPLISRLSVVEAIPLYPSGVIEKAVRFPRNPGLLVRSSHQYFKARGICNGPMKMDREKYGLSNGSDQCQIILIAIYNLACYSQAGVL